MDKITIIDDVDSDNPKGSGFYCYICKHSTDDRICKAFGKIPDDIWFGKIQHIEPYPGDNGLRYEEV
jgi:hypothetical protein